MRILISLLILMIIFSLTILTTAKEILEVYCEEPFTNFQAKCSIKEECGGGFFIVYGKPIGLPLVKKISKISKEIKFFPKQEGKIKVYYICFSPMKIRSSIYEVKPLDAKTVEGSLSLPLSMLTQNEEKSFIVKNLPADKCYWIRPTLQDGEYIIEINIYKNEEPRCLSGYISTERIVTKEFVNVEQNCICNQDVLLKKSDKGIEIRIGK